MLIFEKFEIFRDAHSGATGEPFRENLLIKSRNQNIFEKFKLNRNIQTIPFKMMYNTSMLRHRFSNERWGTALNHLPLLFCKSVYFVREKNHASSCGLVSLKGFHNDQHCVAFQEI